MQREEYNFNQRTWQLDIHEAHLRIHECRCDRCETEICVARMRVRIREVRVDQNRSMHRLFQLKCMLGLVQTLLG
jgi:hypothetical protein